MPSHLPRDIYINLLQADFIDFGPGTYTFVTGGGSGLGIVIYRFSEEKFAAFDRMCTNDKHEPVRIDESEASGLYLECPECHSKYFVQDGSVVSGQAQFYLTEFRTTYYANTNTLVISNW